MKLLLGCAFAITLQTIAVPQERYVPSAKQDIIPLPYPAHAVQRRQESAKSSPSKNSVTDCSGEFTYGYDTLSFFTTFSFGAYHRDVLGMWFVAKATGTIDTLYWINGSVGTADSIAFVRIHRPRIVPSYGPGIPPFHPPCASWGYWIDSLNSDGEIAPFPSENVGSWVSTYPGADTTLPPFEEEIWGNGGYPVRLKANSVNALALIAFGQPFHVELGDVFFISFTLPPADGFNGHIDQSLETRTEWFGSSFTVSTGDEEFPSRLWKFYNHLPTPVNCFSDQDIPSPGWYARGGATDALSVYALNIWYSMSVESNTPPQVETLHTISLVSLPNGQPWSLTAEIIDCNVANPANGGVAAARIEWSLNDAPQPPIALVNIGGDVWEITFPANLPNSIFTWRLVATDFDGMEVTNAWITTRIVSLRNDWYNVELSSSPAFHPIRETGTELHALAFTIPPQFPRGPTTFPGDDGTAGPIDMGGDFVVFGDTFRYASIGVNGAISLTRNGRAELNEDGFYTGGWTIPEDQIFTSDDRVTTLPSMLIAPLWSDLVLWWDSTQTKYGHIRFGNGGDNCHFIVEWDSLGIRPGMIIEPDGPTCRVILNRCNGVIRFEYEQLGQLEYYPSALVGMQNEPQDKWIFLNKFGIPQETTPTSNSSITFTPRSTVVGVEDDSEPELPKSFTLHQNYPNPFNPKTDIRFQISEFGLVTLRVYDVLGREVSTLVNERRPPGEYSIQWDAGNNPSGIYYYQITSGINQLTKKMLLLK